jgi:hypothetical protein
MDFSPTDQVCRAQPGSQENECARLRDGVNGVTLARLTCGRIWFPRLICIRLINGFLALPTLPIREIKAIDLGKCHRENKNKQYGG